MPVNQYKKVEKEFADRIGAWLRRVWSSIGAFLKYIMVKGKQRFTVMLIPHSEKKIFNFQISFFTLIFATCLLGIVLVGFFLLATHFTYTNDLNLKMSHEMQGYTKTLTSLKDEIATLRALKKRFASSVGSVLTAAQSGEAASTTVASIVAASFPSFPEASAPSSNGDSELADLKSMTALVENSSVQLEELSKSLQFYQDFFANTPTAWPLKSAVGIITTRFGWTTNPFTKIGYMHTGVDIAWPIGTPVVATADGTVVQVVVERLSAGQNNDLGNFITIQHKYGFYTRYAHLSSFGRFRKGDSVKRGDVIGAVGNTGLATGPHLHYEVRLGAQYINPMQFLSTNPKNPMIALTGKVGE